MNATRSRREGAVVRSHVVRKRSLPNRARRDPRWAWLAGGLAALVLEIMAAAALSPRLVVDPDDVVVIGAKGGLARRVASMANVPAANLLWLDVDGIKRRVSDVSEVGGVDVVRRLPNRVELQVRPRVATSVLRAGRDRWMLTDRTFVPFRTVESPPEGLPRILFHRMGAAHVVPGLRVALPEEADAVRQCWNWCRRHPEFPVGSVTLDRQGRLCLNGTSGAVVQLGGPERLDLKLESLARLLEARPELGKDTAVRYVNLFDEGSAAVAYRTIEGGARKRSE